LTDARGINGARAGTSINGCASATGSGAAGAAGAGAGADVLDFFLVFFFFLPLSAAPPPAAKQNKRAPKSNHCQISKLNPDEPEAVEPELPAEPEMSLVLDISTDPEDTEFAELRELKEFIEPRNDAKEFPEPLESPEPDEESHGVCVTVVAGAGVTTSVFLEMTVSTAPSPATDVANNANATSRIMVDLKCSAASQPDLHCLGL